jgi:DNA polymerase-3 subunit delta'
MHNPLDEIIGQNNVKIILKKIFDSGRIPHALLFTGKEGVGKEFTAIQLAKYLIYNNEKITNKDFVISSIHQLHEPYIKYICALPRGKGENEQHSPYDKLKSEELLHIQSEFQKKSNNPYYSIEIPNANNIKINSIREISNFISFSYDGSFKRIIIISNAHLMKDEAQNALLKNLEEPPENIIFILTSPYPEFLKETILSRCWKINFENLKPNDVKQILIKFFYTEEKLAEKVSQISLGSVKTALQFLEYDLEFLTQKVIRLLRYCFAKKFHSALNETNHLVNDKTFFKAVISLIILWFSFYNRFRHSKSNIPIDTFSETIHKFTSKYPSVEIQKTINTLEDFHYRIDRNINPNILASNLIIKLSSII